MTLAEHHRRILGIEAGPSDGNQTQALAGVSKVGLIGTPVTTGSDQLKFTTIQRVKAMGDAESSDRKV